MTYAAVPLLGPRPQQQRQQPADLAHGLSSIDHERVNPSTTNQPWRVNAQALSAPARPIDWWRDQADDSRRDTTGVMNPDEENLVEFRNSRSRGISEFQRVRRGISTWQGEA